MKNRLKYFLLTVTLGAIGSGLWEYFLAGATNKIIKAFGETIALISDSYLDYLYKDIGNGVKESFSYFSYSLLSVLLIFSVLITSLMFLFLGLKKAHPYYLFKKIDNSIESGFLQKLIKNRFFLTFYGIQGLISVCIFTSTTIKDIYSYNTIIYVEKSLDILAPTIDNQKLLELRAKYRRIDTYESFSLFLEELNYVAKSTNSELPKHELILL